MVCCWGGLRWRIGPGIWPSGMGGRAGFWPMSPGVAMALLVTEMHGRWRSFVLDKARFSRDNLVVNPSPFSWIIDPSWRAKTGLTERGKQALAWLGSKGGWYQQGSSILMATIPHFVGDNGAGFAMCREAGKAQNLGATRAGYRSRNSGVRRS